MSTNYAINADGNMCRSFIAPLFAAGMAGVGS
jgi:hypothetical protein